MMKFQEIKLDTHYPQGYAKGAKPAHRCVVTLQYGEASYENVRVELPPAAVHDMIALAVREAAEKFSVVDESTIHVEGVPGEPEPPVIEDPEYLEVAERLAPARAPLSDEEVL